MSSPNITQIARRYAVALFELSVESGTVAQVAEEAKTILGYLNENVRDVFKSPIYSEGEKQALIDTLVSSAKLSQTTGNFLRQLGANRRLSLTSEALTEYLAKADEYAGIQRVEVFSAKQLTAQDLGEFESKLAQVLGKKVIVTPVVDESLKAGYIVKVGNTIIDSSLKSRLTSLKSSLN